MKQTRRRVTHIDIIEALIYKHRKLKKESEVELEEKHKSRKYIKGQMEITEDSEMESHYRKSYDLLTKDILSLKTTIRKCEIFENKKSAISQIIKYYNKANVEATYKDGIPFQLSYRLGKIFLSKTVRKKKRVNWKASNDYKEELIKQGVKLYDSETGLGKKWLIYHEDPYNFVFRWPRSTRWFRDRAIWYFMPIKGPRGHTIKAIKYFKKNPKKAVNFKIIDYEKHNG